MKQRFLPVMCLFVAAAFITIALSSCGPDENGGDSSDTTGADTDGMTAADTSGADLPAGVPSPSEMFAFMKVAGAKNADFNLLNPVENEKKYESKKAQSLNLGIYSADLLYCSTFGAGSNKVVPYFGVCVRMGDKLKVATSLTEKDKDRISKNAGNADSLIAISSDLYLSSFENLEQGDRGADLSLMLAGGWVETLYLMSSMVKDFEKDKQTAEHIAEQKISLDNLLEFISKYESNENVKAVSGDLKELQTLFADVQMGRSGGMTMKNNKRVLGGGAKTEITKDQFEKIKTKIGGMRTSFIAAQ